MTQSRRQDLFLKVAGNGFGDHTRRIAQAMDWFNGAVFVGTGGRSRNPLGLSDARLDQMGAAGALLRSREAARGQGPGGASLWRHDPAGDGSWDEVWRSPPTSGSDGRSGPRDRNLRASLVFQAPGETAPALYFGVSAMDGPVRLIRSATGTTFEDGPTAGLGLGETADVPSIRCLCTLGGRVYTSPVGMARGRGMLDDNMSILPAVLEADHPFADSWRQVSAPGFGDPDNLAINELAVHGGFLYAGTLNIRRGYQVWRSDLTGRPPYRWDPVIRDGGGIGPALSIVSSLRGFGAALYVGVGLQRQGRGGMDRHGPIPGELLRVHPDGTWEVITGAARLTPAGLKRPLSGLGGCFGRTTHRGLWHMEPHGDRLFAVGGDWRVFETYLPGPGSSLSPAYRARLAEDRAAYAGGFSLHATTDGTTWETVFGQGLDDNPDTYAARILKSTPAGLFLATAATGRDRTRGGMEVWRWPGDGAFPDGSPGDGGSGAARSATPTAGVIRGRAGDGSAPPPVVVLAPPCGQGAWLAAALGRHPALVALTAIHLFAGETWGDLAAAWTGPRLRLRDGLLRVCARLGLTEPSAGDPGMGGVTSAAEDDAGPAFAAEDDAGFVFAREDGAGIAAAGRWLDARAGMPVGRLFAALQDRVAPRALVDASYLYPLMPAALDRLAAACPAARFVHLVRHPLDHLLDTGLADPDPHRHWLAGHLAVLEFLADCPPDRQIRVRAEDLWADPACGLAGLCDWLGLERSAAILAAMARTEEDPWAGPGPAAAPAGVDPAFARSPSWPVGGRGRPAVAVAMDDPLAVPLGEEVRHYARRFGYP